MAVEVKIPEIGESITEVQVGVWLKPVGDPVAVDEPLVEIESEKATVELPSPVAGRLAAQLKATGEMARVGEVVATIDEQADAEPVASKSAGSEPVRLQPAGKSSTTEERAMPSARRLLVQTGLPADAVPASGPGGRLLKEDVQNAVKARSAPAAEVPVAKAPAVTGQRSERAVPMSPMRRTIARRMLEAQQTAALLTTFNEVDMSQVKRLRRELGEAFLERHGVKLGMMSFFVRAAVEALLRVPQVNAFIRGDEIVYRDYCDVGIAVGGGKGLVVPVIRDAQTKDFGALEQQIADFATRARAGKLELAELEGGSFTITNGGVFGSLLSTPIVNPPQSAILGMHAVQDRPVARDGEVVVRPMMYVALTYDHRIVDGREAVTFLRTIKELVERPERLLLDV